MASRKKSSRGGSRSGGSRKSGARKKSGSSRKRSSSRKSAGKRGGSSRKSGRKSGGRKSSARKSSSRKGSSRKSASKRGRAGGFAVLCQLVNIFQIILNRDCESVFHLLSVPKRDRRTCKEGHESDIETCAFCSFANRLRQNAFDEQPGNRHRQRVDCCHPYWEGCAA